MTYQELRKIAEHEGRVRWRQSGRVERACLMKKGRVVVTVGADGNPNCILSPAAGGYEDLWCDPVSKDET